MRTFGLIGKTLSHSFSYNYFKNKFIKEKITNSEYINFEINNITELMRILSQKDISGLNVTIPYKEKVIPLLDDLTKEAKAIGAVNTIAFKNNKLIGYNTDVIGFRKSIIPILEGRERALILGNGGSAKSIRYALKELNIEYKIVGRNRPFNYSKITPEVIRYYDIIINTTPIGMFPNINNHPNIPFQFLDCKHLLFDLVYNPEESLFLKYGSALGCKTKNGLEMLHIQAEESWKIWTS